MQITIGIGGLTILLLIFLLGGASAVYIWMRRRAFRNVFLAYDPRLGSSGGIEPTKLKLGKRFHIHKGPGGERQAFGLLPGYSIPFGKGHRGTAYMGNVHTGQLMRLSVEEIEVDDQIELNEEEIVEVLKEIGLPDTPEHRKKVQVLTGGKKTVRVPDARQILAIIEDVRELKVVRAAKDSQKSGGMGTLLLIVAILAGGWLLLRSQGA